MSFLPSQLENWYEWTLTVTLPHRSQRRWIAAETRTWSRRCCRGAWRTCQVKTLGGDATGLIYRTAWTPSSKRPRINSKVTTAAPHRSTQSWPTGRWECLLAHQRTTVAHFFLLCVLETKYYMCEEEKRSSVNLSLACKQATIHKTHAVFATVFASWLHFLFMSLSPNSPLALSKYLVENQCLGLPV